MSFDIHSTHSFTSNPLLANDYSLSSSSRFYRLPSDDTDYIGRLSLTRESTESSQLSEKLSSGIVNPNILKDSLDTVKSFSPTNHKSFGINEKFIDRLSILEISDDRKSILKCMNVRNLFQYVLFETRKLERQEEITLNSKSPYEKSKSFSVTKKQDNPITNPITNPTRDVEHRFNQKMDSSSNKIKLRDIRRLDNNNNYDNECLILIRRHVIIIVLDPIRAIIMANRLMFIIPKGGEELSFLLEAYMKAWFDPSIIQSEESVSESMQNSSFSFNSATHPSVLQKFASFSSFSFIPSQLRSSIHSQAAGTGTGASIPYEIHSYDALFTIVKALEIQLFDRIYHDVQNALDYYKIGSLLSLEIQEWIRHLKNQLLTMFNRLSNYRKLLRELTENEYDMTRMKLSSLRYQPFIYEVLEANKGLSSMDNEEIEAILESYLMDFNALYSKIELLQNQIQNAEELVAVRLNISRNELLIVNTILAVLACSISFAGKITNVFGMNLDNDRMLEPIDNLFVYVVVAVYAILITVFLLSIFYLYYYDIIPRRMNYQSNEKQ